MFFADHQRRNKADDIASGIDENQSGILRFLNDIRNRMIKLQSLDQTNTAMRDDIFMLILQLLQTLIQINTYRLYVL